MLRFFLIYVLLTFIINLDFDPSLRDNHHLVFTEVDQHKEIVVRQMEVFKIQLPTQMGTGYQWTFSEVNHSEVKLLSQIMHDDKPLPGGRQLQLFSLKVLSKGSYSIRLALKRHWEAKAIRHVVLRLNVIE
ncbi:putative secreted protein [Catalinimonas alkaloidigena]|uniref:protease inhibitor I42 family protein n=1 Tax=Catalinimonas alkaloidigena TaxID=1075417 RepID=UPI00240583E1|nr:protease inhibitor I42 family protein [Catalinimonas alkaloidigena]MDF9799516.1 putative secreted protein [Catalinimonas alkaloidigena]